MGNNIDELRVRAGMTVQQLADRSGISRAYLNKLKAGDKRLNVDVMGRLARALAVQPADIIGSKKIPVVGLVGAGGNVYPVDDLPLVPSVIELGEADSMNCEWVDSPPGTYPQGIVALRVAGDSMLPFMPPGTVVYYANRYEGGAPDDCIAKLCVVMTRDGAAMLKMVRKSHFHGKFDLVSYNHDTISDVELAWCAPVIFIKPI